VPERPGARPTAWCVTVIGGRVTGLQSAITCAERGHKTILFEKKPYLDGMWHQGIRRSSLAQPVS
jgi:heterodisulfide reductase subunit A-like polyferredoxin